MGAVLWQSGWGYILPVWPCPGVSSNGATVSPYLSCLSLLSRLLSMPLLFGRCSAVDVTGLLAIIDPFFIFHWFCLVFLHNWFQSHSLHVVYLTLCFPACPCQRWFVCIFVYYVLVRDGFLYPLLFYLVFLIMEFCQAY